MSQKKKEPPKRKIIDEGRLFNDKWTGAYFFVKANSKALCLLCREFVQVFKENDLKCIICKNMLPNPICMKDCVIGQNSRTGKKSVFSTKIFSESYNSGGFHCKS